MDSTVLCAVISASGVVLSAVIAFFTAKLTAISEVRKQRELWSREDAVSYRTELADFSKCLEMYANYSEIPFYKNDLIRAAAALKIAVPTEIGQSLDRFQALLRCGDPDSVVADGRGILLMLRCG